MNNLDIMKEAAALAGYTITGSTGQDPTNKSRAQRRLNIVKADVISRFSGKWPANYREGWLPLSALYNTGTATFTTDSRTVTGTNTVWTSAMKGRKIKAPDNAYYKIASVTDGTTLVLSQPFQGTTATASYQIWQDEYVLYPEALTLGGFIDYNLPMRATESWPSNMKESYPYPTNIEEPTYYTVLHKKGLSDTYSTGTVSGTINTNVLTGSGTSWLSNLQPGYEITIGSYTYHIKCVNSDTEIELYQLLVVNISVGTSYSARGKNAIVVRFRNPTNQRIVHYWYYAKDYPFVNDSDEDWVAEQYPRVLVNGMSYFDYIDKNDVARGFNAQQVYENSIKDMKVAIETAYTGIRTLGIYIPPEARD